MLSFKSEAKHPGRAALKQRLDQFMASPQYIAALMVLTLLAAVLRLELVAYGIFTVIAVYTCLWGPDLLPMMPLFICSYIAPSVANNPGRSEASVFSAGHGGIAVLCMAALIICAILFRLIRDRKQFFSIKYRLLPGIGVLCAAYLLSGIGTAHYGTVAGKNILFALVQGCSVLIPYFLFSGGVRWQAVRRDYFPWIGFCTGGVLIGQILWIYLTQGVIVDGVIHRTQIYAGWGMYNNIGGLLTMMIPFAFYLATKYHRGWIGTVVGSTFFIGILLTCSRSSILTGFAIYMVCIILMLYYARNRKANTIAILSFIGLICFALLLFHRQILTLFSDLLEKGLDPSSRDLIYREGLQMFKDAPVLGNSFYSPAFKPWEWSTNEAFTGFFPPRWHNTFVQLLTCCGTVGFAAYLLHRIQTLQLLLCSHSKEKTFIACSVLALLGCSLFDCHFFNIGPVLFYSMALAFAENCHAGK